MGNFFKNPKNRKKREKKEIWLSQGIYVYSRIEIINKGYENRKNL
jgi:hypothetical protein